MKGGAQTGLDGQDPKPNKTRLQNSMPAPNLKKLLQSLTQPDPLSPLYKPINEAHILNCNYYYFFTGLISQIQTYQIHALSQYSLQSEWVTIWLFTCKT